MDSPSIRKCNPESGGGLRGLRPALELRPLGPDDEALLWEYLLLALFVPEGHPAFPPAVVHQPELAIYVSGWGRHGDVGALAMDGERDVGAAWLRSWHGGEKGYGFIDEDTPELSMAVRPEHRGQGVGTLLLRRLLREAEERYAAVSLSVSKSNPAMKLYERWGFVALRSSGESVTMRRSAGSVLGSFAPGTVWQDELAGG